jgi:hypothetical protein
LLKISNLTLNLLFSVCNLALDLVFVVGLEFPRLVILTDR